MSAWYQSLRYRARPSSRVLKAAASMVLVAGWMIPVLPVDTANSGEAAASSHVASALKLDAATLKLINRGDWIKAIDSLRKQSAGESSAGNASGWLAFAYMFENRCADLSAMADKLPVEGNSKIESIIRAFNLICQNKLDDAQKLLDSVSPDSDKDTLANFAKAAVAGKKGQPARAIAFCRTAVEQAPDFAWGYRTIGYLQWRWLKDAPGADAAFTQSLAIEPEFPEVLDSLVDVRLSHNDFDGAVDTALSAIKSAPRKADNYYRLAQIYLQQWRLKEALNELNKALAIDGSDARFHRSKASILRYQGNLPAAIEEQAKAVELSKDKPFELMELAGLNLQAGNSAKAVENLQEALKLEPDNQLASQRLVQILLKEKRYDDLAAEYRRRLAGKPQDPAMHLGLARALKLSGKIDESIKEYKEAANLDQNDAQSHREVGAIYAEQKDYAAAAREYTHALNINPSSVEDLAALGYCYVQSEDYLRAEAALMTALALQQLTPSSAAQAQLNHVAVMRSLAALLLEEGRYADSSTQFEAVCAFGKGANLSDQFQLSVAKSLRDRSGLQSKEMLDAFDKLTDEQKMQFRAVLVEALLKIGRISQAQEVLDKIPDGQFDSDTRLTLLRARVERLKGNLSKAQEMDNKAISIMPKDSIRQADGHLELAKLQLAKGDLTGAESSVTKAIESNPKSYAAFETSGEIYLKRGDFVKAIEAGRKALELNPYYAQAYLLIGDAQMATAHTKEAADQYRKAVELYPGWLEPHKSLLNACRMLNLKEEIKSQEEAIDQIGKRQ